MEPRGRAWGGFASSLDSQPKRIATLRLEVYIQPMVKAIQFMPLFRGL
jgi:hypothetical protein